VCAPPGHLPFRAAGTPCAGVLPAPVLSAGSRRRTDPQSTRRGRAPARPD